MIIDTHAHVVPGSLIETLRTKRRACFPRSGGFRT